MNQEPILAIYVAYFVLQINRQSLTVVAMKNQKGAKCAKNDTSGLDHVLGQVYPLSLL